MQDLTSGNEGKLIFNFAAPMLIGNIFQQLFSVVDSIVVGKFIGKDALAAVGASFPVIFIMVSMIVGLMMGTTVTISQYFGAKNMTKIKRAIDTMYIYSAIIGVITTIVGILVSEPILRMIDLPEELMPQATLFLKVYLSGIVIFFGFNGTSSVLRGLGDSKTPLYFLIIASVANMLFVILFVGVFEWGVAGAAAATLLANAIAFGLAAWWLNRTHKLIRISIKGLTFDREVFQQSLRIGLPTAIQHTLVAMGGIALMDIVNKFGTEVIAGYSVASRLDSLALVPAMSFSQALSTFTGQNIGANRHDRIRTGLTATIKMAGIVTVITTIIIVTCGHIIMSMFTTDQEVIRVGDQYLTTVSAFYLAFTMMFIYNGVTRGAGDTFMPMIFSLFSLWLIRIPIAWFFSSRFGVQGIWWSIPAGWMIGYALSYFYYRTGRWKTKSVIRYADFQQ
ncbi:MAG: MATE family efflux transporter [Bacteroidales bacterium]|jgi:putative MATE family efflux protein|nr:MATE family efflux transporter [Bacteroidales bacterium]